MAAKQSSPSKQRELQLPIARIKTIMKSSPDVESIGQDSLFLITKATELFIQSLAQRAHQKSAVKEVEYKHIADVIQTDDEYDFLREILPRKVKVKDVLASRKGKQENEQTINKQEQESDSE